MKPIYTAAALAGLGLALTGCSAGQQQAALCEVSQGISLAQSAQFITNDPVCVIGRAGFISQCAATGQLIDANAAEHAAFDATPRAAQTQTQVQIPGPTLGENE
jgi:hypothetical protein